jgi:hypothetical protein
VPAESAAGKCLRDERRRKESAGEAQGNEAFRHAGVSGAA